MPSLLRALITFCLVLARWELPAIRSHPPGDEGGKFWPSLITKPEHLPEMQLSPWGTLTCVLLCRRSGLCPSKVRQEHTEAWEQKLKCKAENVTASWPRAQICTKHSRAAEWEGIWSARLWFEARIFHVELEVRAVICSVMGRWPTCEVPQPTEISLVSGNRHLSVLKAALLRQLGLILPERPNMFQLCSHPNPGEPAEKLQWSLFATLPAIWDLWFLFKVLCDLQLTVNYWFLCSLIKRALASI